MEEDFRTFFQGKTVTLMGLGLLGRGIGDAAFLAQHCKKVFVTDVKPLQDLAASVAALQGHPNIEFVLGHHDPVHFTSVDFIIKGAGVRLDNPFIRLAEQHHIPVYMSTALFVKLSGIKTIGITGTRGKSSTTYMIASILEKAGRKFLLGGNVRGVSTLAQLPQAHDYDYAVLELDSWQLQGFDTLGISPHLSVFTTFYPDHLNYYDGNQDRYFLDKAAIYKYQCPNDSLITSEAVANLIDNKKRDIPINSRHLIAPPLPTTYQLRVAGAHNRLNAALARNTALELGIDEATILGALNNFEGVEGRLQYVGTWRGRKFYNDSNATTQEATLAALTSFAPESIVLIFGGADKGLPISSLTDYIQHKKIRCVLIKGTGTDRIIQHMPSPPIASSMPEAFQLAEDMSQTGDHVILSPAFASFGVFKNEYDRSDQFLNEVNRRIAMDD